MSTTAFLYAVAFMILLAGVVLGAFGHSVAVARRSESLAQREADLEMREIRMRLGHQVEDWQRRQPELAKVGTSEVTDAPGWTSRPIRPALRVVEPISRGADDGSAIPAAREARSPEMWRAIVGAYHALNAPYKPVPVVHTAHAPQWLIDAHTPAQGAPRGRHAARDEWI